MYFHCNLLCYQFGLTTFDTKMSGARVKFIACQQNVLLDLTILISLNLDKGLGNRPYRNNHSTSTKPQLVLTRIYVNTVCHLLYAKVMWSSDKWSYLLCKPILSKNLSLSAILDTRFIGESEKILNECKTCKNHRAPLQNGP